MDRLMAGFIVKVTVATIMIIITVMVIINFQGISRQPEYRDEYHEGIIIAKNDTRLIFYVEEQTGPNNFRVWTLDVGVDEFFMYEIGDRWSWVLKVLIHQGGMVNVTVSQGD